MCLERITTNIFGSRPSGVFPPALPTHRSFESTIISAIRFFFVSCTAVSGIAFLATANPIVLASAFVFGFLSLATFLPSETNNSYGGRRRTSGPSWPPLSIPARTIYSTYPPALAPVRVTTRYYDDSTTSHVPRPSSFSYIPPLFQDTTYALSPVSYPLPSAPYNPGERHSVSTSLPSAPPQVFYDAAALQERHHVGGSSHVPSHAHVPENDIVPTGPFNPFERHKVGGS